MARARHGLRLANVKRRRRWLADLGVLRYEKHGKLWRKFLEARAAARRLPTTLVAPVDRL